MPKRIVISGYYGFGNTGDEAVLAGMLASFAEVGLSADVTVLSANPVRTVSDYPSVDAADRWKPWAVIRAILNSDLVISGGGSLIQDATGPISPYYYLFVLRLAQILRRKTVIYAQGVGPLIRPCVRRAAAKAFNNAAAISVRDSESEELLKSLGVTSPISVCADPSFVLEPDAEAAEGLLSRYGLAGRDFIAVSLRPWPRQDTRVAAAAEGIADASYELNVPLLYIPMQAPEDLVPLPQLAKHRPPAVLESPAAPRAAKGVIARAGIVVGMRLHSLIFAASEAVPFVPIAYDPKVESFARGAGIVNAPRLESVIAQTAKSIVVEAWHRRQETRSEMVAKASEWKLLALDPALIVKDLLQG